MMTLHDLEETGEWPSLSFEGILGSLFLWPLLVLIISYKIIKHKSDKWQEKN